MQSVFVDLYLGQANIHMYITTNVSEPDCSADISSSHSYQDYHRSVTNQKATDYQTLIIHNNNITYMG